MEGIEPATKQRKKVGRKEDGEILSSEYRRKDVPNNGGTRVGDMKGSVVEPKRDRWHQERKSPRPGGRGSGGVLEERGGPSDWDIDHHITVWQRGEWRKIAKQGK